MLIEFCIASEGGPEPVAMIQLFKEMGFKKPDVLE